MKTMKTLFFALVLLALAVPGFAQTPTTQTVLSASVASSSAKQLNVASATGISASTASAQTFIFVGGEQMQIQAISGTTLTVIRGVGRTFATPHNLNDIVWYGAGGGRYDAGTGSTSGVFVPVTPIGPCTATNSTFLPIVNPTNGDVSNCIASYGPAPSGSPALVGTTGHWQTISLHQYAMGLGVTNVADVAYTATLADTFINYVTLTTTRVLTLPAITGIEGKIIIVKKSSSGTSAITVTSAAQQGVGTGPGTGTVTVSGQGESLRLISIIAGTSASASTTLGSNAYTWATF